MPTGTISFVRFIEAVTPEVADLIVGYAVIGVAAKITALATFNRTIILLVSLLTIGIHTQLV